MYNDSDMHLKLFFKEVVMIIEFIFSYWEAIVTVIAVIVAILAYFLAKKTYKLQKKTDKDLQRMDTLIQKISDTQGSLTKDVTKIETVIKEVSKIQNKVFLETERNRIVNLIPYSNLSEDDRRELFQNITDIFLETKYDFFVKYENQKNSFKNIFTVSFIKEKNGLSKMYYPSSQNSSFPYFCVSVIEKNPNYHKNIDGIQTDKCYYLHYNFSDQSWYIGKKYPLKDFQVIFAAKNAEWTKVSTSN